MKKIKSLFAWVLVLAMICSNVDYVRAEGQKDVLSVSVDTGLLTTSDAELAIATTDAEDVELAAAPDEAVNVSVSADAVDSIVGADVAEGASVNATGDIASGTWNGLNWVINKDKQLTISGTWKADNKYYADYLYDALFGVYHGIYDGETHAVPWNDYDYITAKVTAKDVVATCGWFLIGDRECVIQSIDLSGFDTSKVTDMSCMFYGCNKLTELDVSGFDTGKVTNMAYMFYGCNSLEKLDVSSFDTSNVTSMSYMFAYCRSLKQLDVSKFDTGSVTEMDGMFAGCSGLEELDVSGFQTGNVTTMRELFDGCSTVKKLDVSKFNTTKVTNMRWMFSGCTGLTELDVRNFNTSKVTDMSYMFEGCSGLKALDVSRFNTSQVSSSYWDWADIFWGEFGVGDGGSMQGMFSGCSGLKSLNLSNFNTANAVDMSEMFMNCIGLESLNISSFNTTKVTDMHEMFWNCYSLTTLDVSKFDTGNVTKMNGMFGMYDKDSALTKLDVRGFKTNKVTDMGAMFQRCANLTTIDLSGFDTSNVTSMKFMFNNCNGLTELNVSKFDTLNVTDMTSMFQGCEKLKTLDLSNFNTSKVTSMAHMFQNLYELTALDVSKFDTKNVTDMSEMFWCCLEITELDVSKFDTGNVTNMSSMFRHCPKLITLDVSALNTGSVTDVSNMFRDNDNLRRLNMSFDTGKVTVTDDMFTGCPALTSIKVPKNLTKDIAFPVSPLYDATGKEYTAFPKGLTESIWLVKNPENIPSDAIRTVKILEELQSAHPYENSVDITWEYSVPNASNLDVTFDQNTSLEQDHDYLYLYHADGTLIGKYTGTELAGKIIAVKGNTIEIKLVSDAATTDYGFKVDSVVAAIPLQSITLDPEALTLDAGETSTLTVSWYPSETTAEKTVTWKSSDEKVATVDAEGKVTAVAKGTATITAVCGSVEATCAVTVLPAMTGVSLQETKMTLHAGQTQTIAYQFMPEGSLPQNIQVSASNKKAATVALDEEKSCVTVKALAAGTTVITLKADKYTATCTVTVEDTILLDYQNESGTKQSVKAVVGEKISALAQIIPARSGHSFIGWYTQPNGQGTQVTADTILADQFVLYACWKEQADTFVVKQKVDITKFFKTTCDKYGVDDKKIASVTKKGVLTGKKPGTVQVTGYVKDGKQWKETETVKLTIEKPVITEKTITKTRPDSTFDGDDNITGTTVKPTSWISSKPAVATVDTSTGRITTVGKGSAKITAVYGEGKQAAKYTFTVKVAIPVMSKKTAKVMTGATLNLKLKNTKLTPAWTSSAPKVASVDNGKVTIHTVGTATITATVDGVGYTCEITVTEPQLKKEAVTIKTGKSAKLGWKNTKLKGDSITWTSSNPKVATVDSTGKVTAVSEGTAVITSKVGGVTGTCTVAVQ